MINVHVLTVAYGEYDDYHRDIVGITTDSQVAFAFMEIGMFKNVSHEVDIVTVGVLDKNLLDEIERFLDPARNPKCECGHTLLHHRKQGKGSCKHNNSWSENRHQCKEFRLAKEVNDVTG